MDDAKWSVTEIGCLRDFWVRNCVRDFAKKQLVMLPSVWKANPGQNREHIILLKINCF